MLIRVERTTEVVLITVSDMDLNTTVRVALVFSWKAIFTAAQVKKNEGLWYATFTNPTGGRKLSSRNTLGSSYVSAIQFIN